jgi:uncharacterized phage infection (PIP) family protein YhgE
MITITKFQRLHQAFSLQINGEAAVDALHAGREIAIGERDALASKAQAECEPMASALQSTADKIAGVQRRIAELQTTAGTFAMAEATAARRYFGAALTAKLDDLADRANAVDRELEQCETNLKALEARRVQQVADLNNQVDRVVADLQERRRKSLLPAEAKAVTQLLQVRGQLYELEDASGRVELVKSVLAELMAGVPVDASNSVNAAATVTTR